MHGDEASCPGAPACQALVGDLAAPAPLPPPVFTLAWRSAPVLTPDDRSAALPALLSLWSQNQAPPPLCRYGSSSVRGARWSVGAGRPLSVQVGQPRPWPLLPSVVRCRPLSLAPPSVARCRPLSLPLIGPAVAELPRAAVSDPPQAAAGQPAQGVGNFEASCALPLSGHTTPMVPAAHPRHAKRVMAVDGGRSRSKTFPAPATRARPRPLSRLRVAPQDNASLWQPAPGQGPCHGSHGQSGSQHR